jgi:DNA (cytosine-5)-methyltransferase 1
MFSGIKGFELGIEKATNGEWECVGYSEIDKHAIQIGNRHFKHRNYGNARDINPTQLPEFDLLCAGFPCQAFSMAGRRKGFEDIRGTLFFEIARIVKDKQPSYLLLENVKGLLNHSNGDTFRTILSTLDELGYNAEWQILNSKNFGVPQRRERVFIIGHLRGKSTRQVFPLNGSVNTSNSQNKRNCYIHLRSRTKDGKRKQYRIYTEISPTVTSECRDWRVDDRMITPLEVERLQGFPDGYTEGISDAQRYKCLGNAVTVNVIESIVNRLEERNHETRTG